MPVELETMDESPAEIEFDRKAVSNQYLEQSYEDPKEISIATLREIKGIREEMVKLNSILSLIAKNSIK